MSQEINRNLSLFIPKPKQGRRLVVGDIHGCVLTFQTLVSEVLKLKKEDQLFLLGDYIDRGPDSGGVIDFILELKGQGFQVFPLKGNHEDMFLDAYRDYEPRFFKGLLRLQKCRGMADEKGEVYPRYLSFLQQLPYFYELDEFYLVHAGFDFTCEKPFESWKSMLWIRWSEPDVKQLNGKRVVHGHTPTHIQDIRKSIKEEALALPLDNGCVYRKPVKRMDYLQLGNLCALDLDNMRLYALENMDMPLIHREIT